MHPAMVGHTLMHGRRIGISPSTWRAAKWARWEPNWAGDGPICTLGPKAKFKPMNCSIISIKGAPPLELSISG